MYQHDDDTDENLLPVFHQPQRVEIPEPDTVTGQMRVQLRRDVTPRLGQLEDKLRTLYWVLAGSVVLLLGSVWFIIWLLANRGGA